MAVDSFIDDLVKIGKSYLEKKKKHSFLIKRDLERDFIQMMKIGA